jgi:hypothetical protein
VHKAVIDTRDADGKNGEAKAAASIRTSETQTEDLKPTRERGGDISNDDKSE